MGQLGQTWTLELPDLLAQVVTRRSSKDTCRWCRWVPVIVPRYHAGRDPAAPNALRLAVYEPRPSELFRLVRYCVCNVFKRVDRLRVDKCARRLSSLLVSLILDNPQSGASCLDAV